MSKDAKTKLNDLLSQIHEALAEEFLDRIKSGDARPSDLNAARQFLKDNYITADQSNSPLADLHEALPFSTEEDDVEPFRPEDLN